MDNGKNRLMIDVTSIISTLVPEADMVKLTIRLEEAINNYEVKRKTDEELQEDIPEKVEMFIAAKRIEGLAEKTLVDYTMELRLFPAYCKVPVGQVNVSSIRSYLGSINGIMSSTVGKKLSVLKSFFGWLVIEEFILRDPTAKVKLPKKPKRLPKSLSIEELELVRESCTDSRQRALIEVFYSTGCRLSEVCGMKIKHLDMQAMSITVIGKGDKERIVYLSYKAVYHLKKYLDTRDDNCEYLFSTVRKPYRQLSDDAVSVIIDKVEKASGLNKKLTPHVFRHSFAQLSTDAGIELSDLQQLLGHSNPSTTLTYASVSEERKQQAHKKFHVQ